MRVASLNLNKRLGNSSAASRACNWLLQHELSLLLAQEPCSKDGRPPSLSGFKPVGGNHRVFGWVAEHLELPPYVDIQPWWQRLELGYLAVHNVYLDPYARRRRAQQIEELRDRLLTEGGRPILVVGDFNLAPRPEDGRFDGKASRFNSEVDRAPFRQLLVDAKLADVVGDTSTVEYTVVRRFKKKPVKFRCDLALVSDYVAPTIFAKYDHSTREGVGAFTDHSAVVLDLPVTWRNSSVQQRLGSAPRSEATSPDPICQPHKTAMARRHPSPFARSIEESAKQEGVRSVLDYGCGYGEDVQFYRRAGLVADGFDPHPPFGWSALPHRTYDLITIVFVLNVLPDPWQRLMVLQRASRHLAKDGRMLVACRSPSAIDRSAQRSRWPRHNDGYWSSERKGTFQRGITAQELSLMARRIGLVPIRDGQEQGDTTRLLLALAGDSIRLAPA